MFKSIKIVLLFLLTCVTPAYAHSEIAIPPKIIAMESRLDTKGAGYCLVASAKRGETRLISVVMGTKSYDARAAESSKLLNYGFNLHEGF